MVDIRVESLAFAIITYCIIFVSIPCFLFLRNVQPIKARSLTLTVSVALSIGTTTTFLFLKIYYGENCLRDFWLDFIASNSLMFLLVLRAARLLLIFNITKSKLEDNEVKHRWWYNVAYVQEPFLRSLVICLIAGLCVIPVIVSIYAGAIGDEAEVCHLTWVLALKYVTLAIALALIAWLAYKLRKVHDGFYLKDEFRILAIFGICVVVPLIILFSIIYTELANFLSQVGMVILLIISYVIPIYKAFRTYYQDSIAGSSAQSSTDRAVILDDVEGTTEKPIFVGFPQIASLMRDDEILEYLNAYILHFQEVQMSDYLMFWLQIREFRKIERREFLAGKAYLLFSKYLKQDGYRHVTCGTDVEISALDTQINESMKEDGPQLEQSFFEAIFHDLEKTMAEFLFPGFLSSKFYVEYKKATRLKMNLESVSVK